MRTVIFNSENVCRKRGRDGQLYEREGIADWIYGLRAAGVRVYEICAPEDGTRHTGSKNVRDSQVWTEAANDQGKAVPGDVYVRNLQTLLLGEGLSAADCVCIDADMNNIRQAKILGCHGLFFENRTLAMRRLAGQGIRALDVTRAADRTFMQAALAMAREAAACGEVPIGCVLVREGEMIAGNYNRRNMQHSTLGHAEILVIDQASKILKDWRLDGCTMYVTLEPCPMCAGAMLQARLPRLVFGAGNPKAGCAGSVLNLLQADGFNHRVYVTGGVCREESEELLRCFFAGMRGR